MKQHFVHRLDEKGNGNGLFGNRKLLAPLYIFSFVLLLRIAFSILLVLRCRTESGVSYFSHSRDFTMRRLEAGGEWVGTFNGVIIYRFCFIIPWQRVCKLLLMPEPMLAVCIYSSCDTIMGTYIIYVVYLHLMRLWCSGIVRVGLIMTTHHLSHIQHAPPT